MSSGTVIMDYLGRGTAASRPATPLVPAGGTGFYYATDTAVLSMWTGAAWVTVGPATGGGGAGFHPGFAANQYYTSPILNTISTFVMTANLLFAMPFFVSNTTTFTKASVRVSTADAGKLVEIGIYANGAGVPTTLEYDCGNVSTTATGQIEITGLSLVLQPGWHWLVVASNSAVTALFSTGSSDALTGSFLGFNAANTVTTGITGPWTFAAGALPASFPAITYVTNSKIPLAWLRL